MFTFEDGVADVLNKAVAGYEQHFEKDFPLYDYVNLTKSKDYDFSVKGAERLAELISKCIKTNRPVETPSDYEKRIY